MKLGLRLFFAFFLIAGLTSFFVLRVFLTEVRPSVREVMEDIMVDTVNLLAEAAAEELAAGPEALQNGRLARQLSDYAKRTVDAQIWGLHKQSLDFRVYVTDAEGQVLLDSGAGASIGEDYSRWRDVALALRGEYGARTSRDVQGDDRSNVMYVAAPVREPGTRRLLGVVSVAKPLSTVQRFIDRAERRILVAGLSLLLFSSAIGVAVTGWLVLNVRRLRNYAQQVQAGERLAVPRVPGELGDLAQAMDAMRSRLEGREHIEQTVRALTHELKSPLAALRGAGELLQDELPTADRQRFAAQVVAQSERLDALVGRMLELSKLELQQRPEHVQNLRFDRVIAEALALLADRIEQQRIRVSWDSQEAISLEADPELLALACSNLLSNALDFAPAGSELQLDLRREQGLAVWRLRDQGPGVPEAAWPQLGERFFSTARPGSARKGTGLGLAIVRQVALLHGGQLSFEPAEPGLRVLLALPAA
ncbi:two-component system sensor histidine kinase CreC [Pelomonas sp. SE-A7]|uniref:two-component system sensor histidine kinase CreC n=1 Tax=Pelomonas sp. SE-A7 TaxID=3054953 RepID=UPI00259C9547|nr:two-component system sensor histidine kinase CreC [Pelomonas sp. SE-A7]MDM4767137.1 two-component system sensor histidine kinase CreC [Pelomonas sp. SE-A7]